MKPTNLIALVLVLAAASAWGCKSNSAEPDSSEKTTRAEQAPGADKNEEDNVQLPVDTTEPTEMLETIDLEKQHLWEERVILLFAPSPDHPDYRKMAADFAEATEAVEERDLVIYHMFWERPGLVGDKGIPVELSEDMRRRHAVLKDAFTYILVGKDGAQKMRSEEAVSAKTVFDEIDSMPMRKREMRQEKDGAEDKADDAKPKEGESEGAKAKDSDSSESDSSAESESSPANE